jgi:hypothetical protein
MKKTLLVLSAVMLFAARTDAATIDLGQVVLRGDFTLNHLFDFNPPRAAPFGSFGVLKVESATGIFAPHVTAGAGDTLAMNTPNVYVASGFDPVVIPGIGIFFGTLPQPMVWSIGGFTLETLWDNVAGADSGRFVHGFTDLSGNGFNPNDYPFHPFSFWSFTAPPYDISDFPTDITGPIVLTIGAAYDDRVMAPEPSSLMLFGFGFAGVVAWTLRRRWESISAGDRATYD